MSSMRRPILTLTWAMTVSSAWPVHSQTNGPIRWDQIGARAVADFKDDGLAVTLARKGAKLRCLFQRLEGEATREGFWLTSTVANQASDRLRVVAVSVGHVTPCASDSRAGFQTRPLADFQIGRADEGGRPAGLETRDTADWKACATKLPRTGAVQLSDKLARFTRPGLVEEYSVSMDGVRQDFVVTQRPEGAGELRVELAVTGASLEPSAHGAQLVLEKSGRKIAYNRLRVTDAAGRELPARMEVGSAGDEVTRLKSIRDKNDEEVSLLASAPTLAVLVDDTDAVYPVRIDPTFSDDNWMSMGGVPGYEDDSFDDFSSGVFAALVDDSGNLYVGGNFTIFQGVPAHNVAKWNGNSWSAVGPGPAGPVFALAVSGTDLYAGGHLWPSLVVKWNGTDWSGLGSMGRTAEETSHDDLPSYVSALAVSGTNLYAGGFFTVADGNSTRYIAKWDGNSWSALGSGMDDEVHALAVSGNDVYAGGRFGYVAKWNGSTWSALGSIGGPYSYVSALAVSGGYLYAGGWFTSAGGTPANNIARWNGSSWSGLGSGMYGGVSALAVSHSDLYAGGSFIRADGIPANYIAKWNGSDWSALGSGMNAWVSALAMSGTNLYAVGGFSMAGNKVSGNVAKVHINGPAPEILVEQPAGVRVIDGVSTVDFGRGLIGSSSQRAFTVANVGSLDLTGLDLVIDGANAGEFAVTTAPAAALPPGGSTLFTITFTPAAHGVRSAILHIASNDEDENPFDLTLTGMGPAPEVGVEQPAGTGFVDGVGSVNFGGGLPGSSVQRTFTITNSGTADLTGLGLTIDGASAGEFAVTANPAALVAPGGSTTFTVTFTPVAAGARAAALHITSNDTDENPFDLTLSGLGMTTLSIAQQAYLKPAAVGTSQATDQFGQAVAISGDTMVVGAYGESSSTTGVNSTPNESASSSGAAYIFVRSGTNWVQQAYLKPAAVGDSQQGDWFGISVAISGDTVVVGASREDSSTTGVNSTPNERARDSGAAYIFVRSGTNWTQQAYLKPAAVGSSQAFDYFGWSVAVSGDTVVVGAYFEDSPTTGVNSIPNDNMLDRFSSGAAYVFARTGTNWTQEAYLKPAEVGHDQSADQFGYSVAVSGDTVVVGAYGESSSTTAVNSIPDEGAVAAGAAYVFVRNAGVWTQQAYLKPPTSSQAFDRFGTSVAVAGDTLVVGSPPRESAYVFVRSGTNWTPQASLKPAVPGSALSFGASVGISGDMVVVGAAHVFVRNGTNWTERAYLKPAAFGTTQTGDAFGNSVAIWGDTIVVGARWEDSSTTGVNSTPDESAADAGAAFVFAGVGPAPEIGVEQPAGVSLVDGVSRVNFGSGLVGSSAQRTFTITNSGSLDLAGLGLTIDGANAGEFTVTASPAASVPPGGSTTFTVTFTPAAIGLRTAALHIASNDEDENPFDLTLFGTIRTPLAIAQQAYAKPAAVGTTQAGDAFGNSVAISGDTMVVGAPYEDSSTTGVNSTPDESASGSGAAYIFVRNETNWTQQAYLKPVAVGINQADDGFGISVAVSGDTVVVGAPGEDSSTTGVNSTPNEGASGSGAAYVFVRSGTNWTQQAYLKPAALGSSFGHSVAVSGDTVVVGASGTAYVFVRSGTNWTQQAYPKPATAGSYFGYCVAVSGDTVVFGAPYEGNDDGDDSGAAYIFVRSGTNWTRQAYLKQPAGWNETFGICVAASGDTLVVGSDPGNSGAAFVFVRSGTNWTQQAYLRPLAPQEYDFFGSSVAVSGNTIVVGAYGEASTSTGVNSTPNENAAYAGAAFVFVRSGTNWTERAYLKPAAVGTSQADDEFGGSVAVSGNTVVVGARGEYSSTTGVNSTPNESDGYSGAAYIFATSPAPFLSLITGVNSFRFQFNGNGIPAFQVQASTNLTNWISVGNATNIGGSLFQFGDAGATNSPHRFYRLKLP